MAYTPYHTDWRDKPDLSTPVTAAALEHIESGIVAAAATADGAVQEGGLGPAIEDYLTANPPAPGADGDDGREVELQTSATHVQWRYVGEAAWTDLVALADLQGEPGPPGQDGEDGTPGQDGEDGADGSPVELQTTATHVQWRVVGGSTWTDLVALSDITGPPGDPGQDAENTVILVGNATEGLGWAGLYTTRSAAEADAATEVWPVGTQVLVNEEGWGA